MLCIFLMLYVLSALLIRATGVLVDLLPLNNVKILIVRGTSRPTANTRCPRLDMFLVFVLLRPILLLLPLMLLLLLLLLLLLPLLLLHN